MIVLDASVVVELLMNRRSTDWLVNEIPGEDGPFIIPHLLDIEVISAIRRHASSQAMDPHQIAQMLAALSLLPAERFAHTPLLRRIWELRHNFTCYDAAYIALAEATDATLLTCDVKLVKGHRAKVRLVRPTPGDVS